MAVETITVKLDANTRNLVRGMSQSAKSISSFASEAKAAAASVKGIVLAGAGLYVVKQAFDELADAARSFVSTSAQFEQYETVLRTITGSSEQARQSMSWIKDFAASTPFNIEKVTESFVKLKAYGIDPIRGDTLRTLGDTAAAMGKDVQQAVEAMADAITGENERLKEFGIKASVQGDKIAYAWTDSSGRVRNIVIKNNRAIIQSTLQAIWNEKYGGAMQDQSRTWSGMVSNMQDQWTNFKISVMDQGVLEYLKAFVGVVGDYIKSMFSDSGKSAKEWSNTIISGIESTIIGVGNMIDVWNGIKLVFVSIKVAFIATVAGIQDGINWIADAYESLKVSISNSFKAAMDAIGKAAYGAVNYILKQISNFVNSIKDALGGVFEYLGQDNPFEKINLSIGEYVSSIETAVKSTERLIDTTWAETGLKEALKDADNLVKALANEEGKNGALKIISDIHDKLKDVTQETKIGNAEKEAARKKLEEIIASNTKNTLETEKAAKALKAYETGLKKINGEAKSLADTLQEVLNISNDSLFADLFGNLMASMSSFGDQLRSNGTIDASGLVVSSLNMWLPGAGDAASLIGGIFSKTLSDAQIEFARGRVDFSDDSLKSLSEAYENAMYPQLEATEKMASYLKSIDDNFSYISKSLTGDFGGYDLSGAGYIASSENTFKWLDGLLGGFASSLFGKTEISLLGSGITIDGTLFDVALKQYMTELIKESSWFGLKTSTSTRTKYFEVSPELASKFDDILSSGVSYILESSFLLGFNKDNILRELENYNFDLGKIDLKGLGAEEVNERLNSAISEIFSGAIDQVTALSDLVDKYAKISEDSLETLGRIALEYDQANYMLSSIGLGLESVLQQVGTLRYGSIFSPKTAPIYDWYTEQERTLDVVSYFDGLEEFNAAFSEYVDYFLSDSERIAAEADALSIAFESLGYTLPKTKDEYISMLQDASNFTTEAGAEVFAALFDLSGAFGAFSEYISASEENIKSFYNMFKTEDELLAEQAQSLGLNSFASSYDELSLFAEKLMDGIDGLNDAELAFLQANKEYIDALNDSAEAALEEANAILATSESNIKTWTDSFKTQEQLVTDMANALGVSTAYSYDALNVMFEQLKSDVDGLNDAELELLNANKAYLEQLDEEAEAKRQATIDDYASQINSLNDELSALTGSVSKNISDVTSLIDAVGRSISSVDDAIAGYINAPTTLSDVTSGIDSFSALSGSEKYAMSDDMIALVGDYYSDVKQQIEDEYDAKIAAISAEQAAAEAAAQARYDALKQEADAINSINDQIKSLQDYANSLILNNTSLDPVQSINMWAAQFTDVMGDLRGAISANNVDDTSMYAGLAKDYSGNYIDAAKIGASTRAQYEMIVAGVANDLNGLGLKPNITLGDLNGTLESIRTTYAAKMDELNAERDAAIDKLTLESIEYLEIVKSQLDEEKLQLETIDATLRDSFPELYEPVANIETTLRRLDDKTLSMEEVQQNIIDTRNHQQNLESLISELNAKIDRLNGTTEKVAQNTDTSTDNLFTQGVA